MNNINDPIIIEISNIEEYKEKNIFFLKEISRLYKKFNNKKIDLHWERTENSDFYIDVESLIYKSPLTLFHSDWGQGKTYFFEQLIHNCFISKKIKLEKYGFKKIIMIDLWKYINTDNFVNEIVYEIYKFLLNGNQKFVNMFKKLVKESTKAAGIILLNCLSGGFLGLSYNLSNPIIKDINKINKDLKKIEPTIVIFDNLERLENNVLFVFKLIQKISMINNLIIILPMDKSKLYINNISQIDYWLEKYITLGNYFIFSQNYKDLLKKELEEHNLIYLELINEIFESEKLNLRTIKQKINFKLLNKNFEKSKYHGVLYLKLINYFKTWNYIYEVEPDVTNILKILKTINDQYYKDIINLRNDINNNHELKNQFMTLIEDVNSNKIFNFFSFNGNELYDSIPRWDFELIKNNNKFYIANIYNIIISLTKLTSNENKEIINSLIINLEQINENIIAKLNNIASDYNYLVIYNFINKYIKNYSFNDNNTFIKTDNLLSKFIEYIEREVILHD